jgi:tetratricopeptide (TPR) repeat protein
VSWEAVHIDDVERRAAWIPLRRRLGIRAFGVNVWKADDEGTEVIGEHDEKRLEHEELYVVMTGHAVFTLDGAEVDAPAGTTVFVRDPAVKRKAVSREPGTTVLAVGAKPGVVFEPSAWEENFDILPLFDAGDYRAARDRLAELVERDPDTGGFVYNLACAEARLGELDAARAHLDRAIAIEPSFAELAESDADLEALRV